MALLSANTLIRSLAILQLVVSYFLISSPSSIGKHNIVVVLSASFNLPYNPPSLHETSALTSLLAAVFAYYSISDLLATSMHEELSMLYWSSQAPIRLLFFFGATSCSMLARPGGLATIATPADGRQAASLSMTGAGKEEGGFASGVVFTWAFLGILGWFWVYITLRDEKRAFCTQKVAVETRRN